MLRHIVLIHFKPEATTAEREAVRASLLGFRDQVPELRGLVVGTNVGAAPGAADLAISADFDDMPAFRRYLGSAPHRAYVDGPAKAVGRITAIQHEW